MKQLRQITKQEIEEAFEKNKVWDLGNEVLYSLCSSHPRHKTPEEIIAKVWLIGRSYAAAIERRRNTDPEALGDSFYTNKVVPLIKDSKIDEWLASLKREPTEENAIKSHFGVTELFRRISGLEKRSLASKYLHFHFPDLFYIYDSRSLAAAILVSNGEKLKSVPTEVDPEYAGFFQRCMYLKQDLKQRFGCELSPRELDKVLTYITDSMERASKLAQAQAGSFQGQISMTSDFDAPLDDFKDHVE